MIKGAYSFGSIKVDLSKQFNISGKNKVRGYLQKNWYQNYL